VIEFLVDHNFNERIVDGLTRRDATWSLPTFVTLAWQTQMIRRSWNGRPRAAWSF
jgi:hypothetical protein